MCTYNQVNKMCTYLSSGKQCVLIIRYIVCALTIREIVYIYHQVDCCQIFLVLSKVEFHQLPKWWHLKAFLQLLTWCDMRRKYNILCLQTTHTNKTINKLEQLLVKIIIHIRSIRWRVRQETAANHNIISFIFYMT